LIQSSAFTFQNGDWSVNTDYEKLRQYKTMFISSY